MIKAIRKDYSQDEIDIFATASPDRYDKLCNIVGRYVLDSRNLDLAIDLPYECDKGCVSAFLFRDDKIHQIGSDYF